MSAGQLGIRISSNPNGQFGEGYVVDGFELTGSLEGQQSGGQDVPEQALEGGYDVRGRNVVNPEEGTLTGAVRKEELGALKQSYRKQELVSVTGPEGTLSECFIESIDRTHEGGYYNKVGVEVSYKQAFLAELGSVTVQAVTKDAKHSPSAGSKGDNGGQSSLVQSDSKNNPNGGGGGQSGGNGNQSASGGGPDVSAQGSGSGGSGDGGGGGFLGGVGNAIGGLF